jgi:hypothetical protein
MKKTDERWSQLAGLVDKLGPIEEELDIPEVALWKVREKAASELRKEITALAGGDANLPLTLEGKGYTAVLGPRENERTLASMRKLFTKLGKMTFLAACGFTLTAFDALTKSWTAEQKAAFLKTERTGSRSVKTFRRAR